jgi:hypothetical protein
MEAVLRHPGFVARIFFEMFFAAQSLATILFLVFRGHNFFRILLMLGGVAVLLMGCSAIIAVLKAAHFEGYVLIIGAALILQAVFTIAALAFGADFRFLSSTD